jgi:hypothetical protein
MTGWRAVHAVMEPLGPKAACLAQGASARRRSGASYIGNWGWLSDEGGVSSWVEACLNLPKERYAMLSSSTSHFVSWRRLTTR